MLEYWIKELLKRDAKKGKVILPERTSKREANACNKLLAFEGKYCLIGVELDDKYLDMNQH